MKFILKTFNEIVNGTKNGKLFNQDGFNDSKNKLTEKYSKLNIDDLHQPRRHQVQFIEKSIELVAHREGDAKILTSLILLQMCVIGRSSGILGEDIYKALQPGSATRSGLRASSYFDSLMKNIGYSATNTLEFADVVELLELAKQFIEAQIYIDGEISNNHAYSVIEELKILHYLKTAVLEIYESKNKINIAVYESELMILANNEAMLKNNSFGKSKKELKNKAEQEEENKSFLSRLTFYKTASPTITNDTVIHQNNDLESDSDPEYDSDDIYYVIEKTG